MSDNVYTAERILAKRKHHGVTQYYIKWKGYSIKESTWEPAENILDRSLLVAFENSPRSKASSSNHHNAHANTSSHSRNLENRTSRNSRQRNESRSSSTSSSASTLSLRKGRGRPRKKSYVEQRQEQVRLQRHIQLQQQQKTHLVHQDIINNNSSAANGSNSTNHHSNNTPLGSDKKQLVIFNPVGGARTEIEVTEEVVYEPELTKNPVLVTDVTSDDLTVTISECRTPEGFFRT